MDGYSSIVEGSSADIIGALRSEGDLEPISLADVSSLLVKCKKPSAVVLSIPAVITSEENGMFEAEINAADLTGVGLWRIWPVVTYDDGRILIGKAQQVEVLAEG